MLSSQQHQQALPSTNENYTGAKSKQISYSNNKYNYISNVCGGSGNNGSSTSSSFAMY